MSRALIILNCQAARDRAIEWCKTLPDGFRLTYHEPKRSTDQNDLMWWLLTDMAKQLRWHDQKMSTEDWKLVFMAGLNQELRMVPNIAGNGFVNLGRSSSKLSTGEMADMITLIIAFGSEHGVRFRYHAKLDGVEFHDSKDGEAANNPSPVAA